MGVSGAESKRVPRAARGGVPSSVLFRLPGDAWTLLSAQLLSASSCPCDSGIGHETATTRWSWCPLRRPCRTWRGTASPTMRAARVQESCRRSFHTRSPSLVHRHHWRLKLILHAVPIQRLGACVAVGGGRGYRTACRCGVADAPRHALALSGVQKRRGAVLGRCSSARRSVASRIRAGPGLDKGKQRLCVVLPRISRKVLELEKSRWRPA